MNRKQFFRAAGHAGACCLLLGPSNLLAGAQEKTDPDPALKRCTERIEFAKRWVGCFVGLMDQQLDEATKLKLMHASGRSCFLHWNGPDPAEPGSMDKLLTTAKKYREKYGPDMIRVEGDVVHFQYEPSEGGHACLCAIFEDGPESLSPTYCQCSVGYVQSWMARISGRPAKAELLESARTGGDHCRFRITLG
jgi:hypothetical protein